MKIASQNLLNTMGFMFINVIQKSISKVNFNFKSQLQLQKSTSKINFNFKNQFQLQKSISTSKINFNFKNQLQLQKSTSILKINFKSQLQIEKINLKSLFRNYELFFVDYHF